ncbi:hypothetical protein [Pantoea agglomerans]|uniref:hypothetical protein n=1 Tax=Enterobacter agglomerans TaxID=549 RepID=UPI003C7C29EB
MTAKKTTEKKEKDSDSDINGPKTCFVIMPIADHPNYEPGHFKRVYDHLVSPACRLAGYEPVRADDNASSNMIMHDILLKIVKSEMVICDLSTNNANVFYELGLRQAFNKKTVLITDGREKTPFDLLGFRYQPYSPTLRIDTVSAEITRISAALTATENLQANEVNSIVKLLEIDSANIEIVQPNENQAFMLQMFNSLSAQISNIRSIQSNKDKHFYGSEIDSLLLNDGDFIVNPNKIKTISFLKLEKEGSPLLHKFIFRVSNKELGKFLGYDASGSSLEFINDLGEINTLTNTSLQKAVIYGHQ